MARHPDLRLVRATRRDLVATLTEINQFANRIRETVWGFMPITPAELDFLTHRIMRVMIPELVLTMRQGDEMVGYMMAVPDVNRALARARGPADLIRLVQMPFLLTRPPCPDVRHRRRPEAPRPRHPPRPLPRHDRSRALPLRGVRARAGSRRPICNRCAPSSTSCRWSRARPTGSTRRRSRSAKSGMT